MNAPTIRPMRWWDLDAVMAIETEVFDSTAWSAAQFWGELAQPTREYVVAEDAEGVAGYAGLFVLPPDSDIQTVAVAPRVRGTGLGRLLVEQLVAAAADRGCTAMMLEVRADNDVARGLYESLGFATVSTRRSYYGPGMDAVIMRCDLRGKVASP